MMKRLMITVAVVLGLLGVPAPAAAWDFAVPKPPAAKDRVIEVVNKLPARWQVKQGVTWLDRYTASRMKLVKSCSGKAYDCITLRAGKVRQSAVAWSSGRGTITVDLAKAKRYGQYYGKAKHRKWLVVHELAHEFGLEHRGGANVMNPAVNRYAMKWTGGQRKHLRNR